jgi:hypothetical protein
MSATSADDDALDAIEVRDARIRAYIRHCYLPASGQPDPLYVNAAQESRWHTAGGTLYLAEDENTVWAEMCRVRASQVLLADPTGGVGLAPANFAFYGPRTLDDPVDRRALLQVEFRVDALADLTTSESGAVLGDMGLTDADLLADDYGPCPRIAKAGERLGWHAIRARSAALDGGVCLAVFHRHHPPRVLWRTLRDSARPVVAIAYLTRYRAGERPPWLGLRSS